MPGAEGITSTLIDNCRITGAAVVAASFGGKVGTEQSGMSGTGNPTCQFYLTSSNIGSSGVVSMSMSSVESAAVFRQVRGQTHGATGVSDVGSSAYYVPATSTLQFLAAHNVVAVQASLRAPGKPQSHPDRLRANLIALGKNIADSL